jgi:hypothetical protein
MGQWFWVIIFGVNLPLMVLTGWLLFDDWETFCTSLRGWGNSLPRRRSGWLDVLDDDDGDTDDGDTSGAGSMWVFLLGWTGLIAAQYFVLKNLGIVP